MSIEFNPPAWQPDAVPSNLGWRHPKTNELLVAIPGGVKQRQTIALVVEDVIDESPATEVIIEEAPVVTTIIDESPVEVAPIIDESPVIETTIKEIVEQPKVPAKRGPKPKAK